jgi:hypothetical protein
MLRLTVVGLKKQLGLAGALSVLSEITLESQLIHSESLIVGA